MNHKQSIIGGIFAFILATSCCWLPLLVGGATGLLSLNESLEQYSGLFMTIALGLFAFGVYQYYWKGKSKNNIQKVQLKSTITCPECGHKKEETMPTDSCQFFYDCEKCKTTLKPQSGDCCVYCSYGSVKCPPIQQGEGCC